MKPQLIIGLDPGANGGIAWITESGDACAEKIPESLADWRDLLRDIASDYMPKRIKCYLEKVHSTPQMGVCSAFSFGAASMQLEMALVCMRMPYEKVPPNTWQKFLGCQTKGDKNVSKRKAQELFPSLKITHAIADALLIAEFGRRMNQ